MKTKIEGYRNHPGAHCGSVAMRGLLHHYCDLELPEAVVFGLGSGVDCIYFTSLGLGPGAVVFGRTATMEVDLASALGVDYSEQQEADDARAWQDVREKVLAGRPTMLSGDILYLDYREFKVHFPAHRFVLLGFDDEREVAYIADRIREEPEVCSYPALFKSRNPPEGISTTNLWGRFGAGTVGNDLDTATRIALDRCARRMLGEDAASLDALSQQLDSDSTSSGVAAIRRLAGDLPSWAESSDVVGLTSYNASCIEKFGNGGGNFRRLYAGFLEWAQARDPKLVPAEATALAWRSADGWTALANALWAAGEDVDASTRASRFADAGKTAVGIADVEQELFERLAQSAASTS